MKKTVNILYLIDILDDIGGAEKNYCQVVTNLDRRRYAPTAAALRVLRFPTILSDHGIDPIILDLHNPLSINGIRWIFRLCRLIKNRGIDLIVTYFEGSDYIAMILHMLTGRPFIVNRRDMGYRYNRKQRLLNRLISKYCNRMIAVSHGVAEKTCENEGITRQKISVIYNAIDEFPEDQGPDIKDSKKLYGINPDQFVVGMLAVLRKVKRHDIFIEAAAKIVKRRPDIKFFIAGFDSREKGATLEELQNLIELRGLSSHFVIRTNNFEALSAMQAMDICVLTSDSEGFSNSILEAMILGKAVVATDVGGNPEIVIDDKTGKLVPPNNPTETANVILELLDNPELIELMGKRAKDIIQTKFTTAAMLKKHETIYQKVLSKNN